MHKIYLSVFLIFFFSNIVAQRNSVRIDGAVKDEKEKLEGVSITVYQNKEFFAKTLTESNGKFRFLLNYDVDYLMEFSKPGYVTKRVSVNTDSVPEENQEFGHEYGGWELSLFKEKDGMDLSLFEKPFVKIAYNVDANKFEHDVEYTEAFKEELVQLEKNFEKQKKEEAKRKKEEEKAAEAAAKKAKLEAEEEIRKEEEKKAKLAQAVMEEEKRKKEKEQKAKIEEEKNVKAEEQKNKDEEYKQLISQGEKAFNNKEYDNAKKKFQNAQQLKPKEPYPQQKIHEIDFATKQNILSANKARRDTGHYKTKEEFLQALAKLYPQGVTEEIYMEGNVKVVRRIVVNGNIGTEYIFTTHPWGGRFWFKNGTPIIESVWNTETVLKK